MYWISLKGEVARMLLDKDALHIYAAIVIQIGMAMLTRRSVGHLLPWFTVLGIELINEWADIWFGPEPELMPYQVAGAAHDILNTMISPTMLLVLCRCAPTLFAWRHAQVEPEADDQGSR